MTQLRIPGAALAIALLALGVRAESENPAVTASGQGAGAGPGSGFDPTGSHPLPNQSVDGQASKSTGCGCRAFGR